MFNIDLHTGYGANGILHLFPTPLKDKDKKARIENIFEGYHIDWGDGDDFYTVTGDFATYVGSTVPDKDYLTMTFEFGILDTQTTMGSIKALQQTTRSPSLLFPPYGRWQEKTEKSNQRAYPTFSILQICSVQFFIMSANCV